MPITLWKKAMAKKNEFGQRLERLCKERGIAVNELARRISISSKTVHEWVGSSGRLPRNPDHIKALAQFFNVGVEFLLFGEENHINLESLISKSEIHTGLYEISIRRVSKKDDDGKKK